jgi:uncharacterized protein YcbK (DUF882 family)
MNTPAARARRLFLQRAGMGAGAVLLPAAAARAAPRDARSLAMVHLHTGERIELVYAVGEQYLPPALALLNRFLRDHYSGDVGTIDPRVFDLLHRTQLEVGSHAAFEVISGYRCEATNGRLRDTRGGGVARRSLHMEGRAVDVRLPGTALADLRDAALALRGGGVGYYPREQFVHLDTGRLRSW